LSGVGTLQALSQIVTREATLREVFTELASGSFAILI
jgi:hypothetical protein